MLRSVENSLGPVAKQTTYMNYAQIQTKLLTTALNNSSEVDTKCRCDSSLFKLFRRLLLLYTTIQERTVVNFTVCPCHYALLSARSDISLVFGKFKTSCVSACVCG
jgi:hypothetical protein